MKINNQQLISLLSERTGMDRGDVNRQLVELVGRIQQAEEDQNTFEIKGFGSFTGVQNRLDFEPAELFETEINNRYSGMKPIELIGAYRKPAAEETIPSGGRKEPVSRQEESSRPPEEEQKTEKEPQKEEIPSEEAPAIPDNDESSKTDRPEEPQEAVPGEAAVEKNKAAEKEKFTDGNNTDTNAALSKKSVEKQDAESSSDNHSTRKEILNIIRITLLVLAGWLAYNAGFFGEEDYSERTASEASSEQQDGLNTTSERLEDDETGSEQSESASGQPNTAEQEQTDNDQPASGVEDSVYGLYGNFNNELNGSPYTIVVHSMRTLPLAEERVDDLQGNNYRIKIEESTVNGQSYFRVGIGQFETIPAAQEAVEKLPAPLRDNNFISRF